MEDWTSIIIKAFWCGWAALGFGILFNVPPRTLFAIWTGGFVAGVVKFLALVFSMRSPVIQASFLAALSAGVFSTGIGRWRHEPAMIYAIPSVIPLVPGVFAYHTMLGLIKLTGQVGTDYTATLSKTIHDGVTTLFIIMAIALGVAIPIHITRMSLAKQLQLRK